MIVLAYHNVLQHVPSMFTMLARKEWLLLDQFEEQIDKVARRYRILPLADIGRAVQEGTEIKDVCAITFDDGGLGGYRYAAPVLERRGLSATFFVITGRMRERASCAQDPFDRVEAMVRLTEHTSLDLAAAGAEKVSLACEDCKIRAVRRIAKRLRVASPSERAGIDRLLQEELDVQEEAIVAHLQHEAYWTVGWEEVVDLRRRGFDVGSHTRSHVSLAELSGGDLEDEVAGSRRVLTERLGPGDISFSYPYGKEKHLSDAAVASVRGAGYACAVTAGGQLGTQAVDPFRLGRMFYRQAKKLNRS